uniref:Blood vessel epicardial substance-B-like n=1 Tax=Phallusia mammillata TaxID=59560 RepID=A0A6F9D8E5_9ASCI|nr:blood vessel epicardial substance-B-like [Phallusia mammillata]
MNGTESSYYSDNAVEDVPYLPGNCQSWLQPQNLTFHGSMALFAAAFLVPVTFKYYVIALRSLLIFAFVLLMVWDILFWCTFDVVIWGTLFLVQNLVQLIYEFYQMRQARFPADLEDVYVEVFEPFNITRREFKALTNQNCKWVNIYPGDKYAVENHTTVEARVSLLVSGCMRVTYKGLFLHDVKEKQMIDSAEWDTTKLKRGEMFQVSIEAIDRCFYLCWNREKLQYYLQVFPKLHAAFEYIRGKDVMDKLYQTSMNTMRRSQSASGGAGERNLTAIDIREGLVHEDPSVMFQ